MMDNPNISVGAATNTGIPDRGPIVDPAIGDSATVRSPPSVQPPD